MSDTQIKALTAKRAGVKRSLSAFENLLSNTESDPEVEIVEKRFQDLEKIYTKFMSYQEELEGLIGESDEVFDHRTSFEETYYQTWAMANRVLKQNATINVNNLTESPLIVTQSAQHLQQVPQHVESDSATFNTMEFSANCDKTEAQMATLPSTSQQGAQQTSNLDGRYQSVNLPAVSLPTFDGSFDAWLGFYDLFHSMVHVDPNIPPIRKLYHLKGCLKGEAADIISTLSSSNANYFEAWKLLKDRYDDRKYIRNSHIKAILNMKPMSKEVSLRSFLDGLQQHLRALQALGRPIHQWDDILTVCIREKLNSSVRDRWDDATINTENPNTESLIEFLIQRAKLEDIRAQSSSSKPSPERHAARANNRAQKAFMATAIEHECIYCHDKEHNVYTCNKFAALTPSSRYEAARLGGWCTNCLKKGHWINKCKSQTCRRCKQKHHTLLHFGQRNDVTEQPETAAQIAISMQAQTASHALLATALVDLVNSQGKTKTCRVFLDAGSQAHFISEETASFLNLIKIPADVFVTGIDGLSTKVKFSTKATIRSRFGKYEKLAEFLVVPHISQSIPSITIDQKCIEIPDNIKLADPEYFKPSSIDLLIGVKLFYKLLCVGQIALKGHPNAVLQKTQLGWIVAGELNQFSYAATASCHLAIHSQHPNVNLTRFWEIEEISNTSPLSPEESACEEHYRLNTKLLADGRYEVRLPFNHKKSMLGESYTCALRRFHALERKLQQNPKVQSEYIKFLNEYLALGHMSLAENQNSNEIGCFLPHHAVLKEQSLTTKTRVVFDASAKTTTGVSLNDTLMVGPKLQRDLLNLLLRFRSHIYVLTADAEKMYRQVRIHEDDAQYQKILYRSGPSQPIQTYVLNTVTYGTASASYLAIKTLYRLADDEEKNFPLGAHVLRNDFYVDDLLTGAKTIAETALIRDELIAILKRGGFHLRKWASNHPSLLIQNQEHPESAHLSLDPDSEMKTLGIHWNAREDFFFYTVNLSPHKITSKRTILSQIAKLFDPLGLLGPIIVYAKIIMQLLWKCGVAWDESVPQDIHSSWSSFQTQLPLIKKLRFQRCLIIPNATRVELHGFCDASETAYGACLYLRSMDSQGQVKIRLIAGKSRVAPVKPLTLPRLELCAALLLSRLYKVVKQTVLVEVHQTFLWSDATIILHWINIPAHRLKTFTSNRVAEIQATTESCHWRHIPSQDNPADLVSRGQLPAEFIESTIWLNGPSWLAQDSATWPNEQLKPVEIPELKPVAIRIACLKIEIGEHNLLERYSSFSKLQAVVAYIMRFIYNTKHKRQRKIGALAITEMSYAHNLIISMVQLASFKKEIEAIRSGDELPASSRLKPLKPIIDEHKILRVGGRIGNAEIPEDQRHPILLPPQHHVTKLIIEAEHFRLKHAGPQTTLYSIRQRYWFTNGRNTIRHIIHKCITCFRAKPRMLNPSMGVLPNYRITSARPFLHVGIDYCGPFYIKERRHRNRTRLKVYVAVYICMCTKAVHLELVSDLTTEAFIGSLKRLFARRGKATEIRSDNATKFVGAKNELNDLYKLFSSQSHQMELTRWCREEKIEWHFIPPRSPHFGGIWEAAVKSFKHHLRRVIGDTLLTFEQLQTCIIEIEAVLNSRPISPLSADTDDLLPLTPGHFLIGGPLTAFPERQLTSKKTNQLSAWQHAQKLKQHFWARWHKEYLQHLMKFNTAKHTSNIKVGVMVLLIDENVPPLQWALGRVVAVHPGKDGTVRVVTVKTSHGECVRCVKKVCLLPITEFEDNFIEQDRSRRAACSVTRTNM